MNGLIIFALECMCDVVCECCAELGPPGYLVISGWDLVIECKLVLVLPIVQLLGSGSGVSSGAIS